MAAVSHCGRVVRFSQVLGFVQRHRSYHKKIRGRVKEQKPRKIDLDELLGGNTAESASSRTTNRTSFASPQNEAKSGGDWQHSQERLTLLRKGEKRSGQECVEYPGRGAIKGQGSGNTIWHWLVVN